MSGSSSDNQSKPKIHKHPIVTTNLKYLENESENRLDDNSEMIQTLPRQQLCQQYFGGFQSLKSDKKILFKTRIHPLCRPKLHIRAYSIN